MTLTVKGIHVSVSGHGRKLHNTCTHLHQNPKSRSSRPSIVYTFSSIQSVDVSLFVFISTQTNVYTHRGNIQERPELPPPTDSDINDVSMYYCALLLLPWVLCEICILSFTILPPSVSWSFIKKKCTLIVCVWCDSAAVDTEKCWVTVAKVRTFAVSKCVHNLSQTSNSIGKLIVTK